MTRTQKYHIGIFEIDITENQIGISQQIGMHCRNLLPVVAAAMNIF